MSTAFPMGPPSTGAADQPCTVAIDGITEEELLAAHT
jgi:hypothetical protein